MSRESDDNLSSINSTYTDMYQETVKRFTRSSLSPEMDRFSPSRMSTKSATTSQKSYHGAVLTADTEQFIIGQKVWVGGVRPGQIAYIGETHFAPGEWAGVVLDEPNGKNDGCVAGKRYFQCEAKRGIFSRLTRLTLAPLPGALITPTSPLSKNSPERSRTVSPTASLRSSFMRSPGKNGLTVGDRVIVSSGFGSRPGILRYLGETQFASGNWCGVELDEATGKNDGSVDGIRYFECKPKYGVFVPIAKVSLSPSSKKTRLSRTGSRESLTSIGTMNSIATTNTSRMRMNAQRKSTSIKPISTPKSQFSMQDLLREKQNHIEQLMIERDLDREDAQNQALQFQKNINELNARVTQLQVQLEDERKKSEELQFSIHEAQCYGDELNAESQVYKQKISTLENKLVKLGTDTENSASSTNESTKLEQQSLVNETQNEEMRLLEKIKYLESEIATLQKELLAKDESLEKFSLSECGIENLRQELALIKEENEKERQRIIADFTQQIEAKNTELQQLKADLTTKNNNFTDLECERKNNDDTLQMWQTMYKNQEIELQSLQEQITKFNTDLSVKTAESATLDELLRTQQAKVVEVNNLLEENIRDNEKLKKELKELTSEKAIFEDKLKTSQEVIQNLSIVKRSMDATASCVETEKQEALQKLQNTLMLLQEKKKEVSYLNEQLLEIQNENVELHEQKNVLRQQNAENETVITELNDKNYAMTRTVTQLNANLAEVKKQHEAALLIKSNELENLNSTHVDLERTIKDLENNALARANELSVTKQHLASQIEKFSRMLENTKADLEYESEERIRQETMCTQKISELKSTTIALQTTKKILEDLTKEHDSSVLNSTELQAELTVCEEKNGELQLELGDLRRKYKALSEKCENFTTQIEVLQQDVLIARSLSTDAQTEVRKLNEELCEKQKLYSELRTTYDAERIKSANQIEEMQQKLTNSVKDNEDLKEQLNKMKDELAKKQEQATALEEKTIKQELSISDAARQQENLQKKCETLAAQNESLQHDLTIVRSTSTDSNEEILKLTHNLSAEKAAYTALVDKTNNERLLLEGQLQASQQRVDTLCNQIETLTQELKCATEENVKRLELLKQEQDKFEKLSLEHGALKRELEFAQTNSTTLSNRNEQLQNDLYIMRAAATEVNDELLKLTEEVNNKQNALQELTDLSSAARLRLESQLQEQTQRFDASVNEIQNLRAQLEKATEQNAAQANEVESLKTAAKELEEANVLTSSEQAQQVANLKLQLKNAEQTKLTLDEGIISLQNQLKILQDELLKSQLDFKSKEEELYVQIKTYSAEKDKLQDILTKMESEGNNNVSALQQERAELSENMKTVAMQLKEKEEQLQSVSSETAQLKISQANALADKMKLDAEIKRVQEALDLANDEVAYKSKLAAADKTKIEELKQMLEVLQIANAGMSATNAELSAALEVLESEKYETANILELFEMESDQHTEKLSEKISHLLNQLTATQAQLSEKESALTENKNQLEAIKLEMESMQSALNETQAILLEQKTKLNESEQAVQELKQLLNDKETELIKFKDVELQLNEYKQVMEELDDASSETTTKVSEMQSHLKKLEQEKKNLIEQEKELSMECKSLQRKIEIQDLEKTREIVALQARISDLQSIDRLKLNGGIECDVNMGDSNDDSSAQINFLNSIIADMQKKNDSLKAKIESLEAFPTDFSQPHAFDLLTKRKPAPRMFCDICDEFDKHETEDCPLQASDDRDSPIPLAEANNNDPANKKERKLPAPRKYCETCEVFGHETGECIDDECY